MRVRPTRIAVESHFDDDAISCNRRVIPRHTRHGRASGREGAGGLLGPVLTFRNQGLL